MINISWVRYKEKDMSMIITLSLVVCKNGINHCCALTKREKTY